MALAGAVTGALYFNQAHSTRAIGRAGQRETARIAVQTIETELTGVRSDVLYLANAQSLRGFLSAGREPSARLRLEADFLAFARHKALYDQVRVLSPSGQELMRVNWHNGDPQVTPEAKLQDKSRRYYVKQTLAVPPGQVYVSPFDLNMEHGRIQQPPKPVIRFSTPVSADDGSVSAMVMVNFLGQRLLDRLRKVASASRDEVWLLNEKGYFLLGPSPEDEWGFMYPPRRFSTMARRFPKVWSQMLAHPQAMQWSGDTGLFTAQAISPHWARAQGATNRRWWVLVHSAPEAVAAETAVLKRNHLLAFAVLAVAVTGIAWVMAVAGARRRQAEKEVRAGASRLRALLEAAPDGVVISDERGTIVLVNDQAEQMFGYRRDELIGKPVSTLLPERLRSSHGSYWTKSRIRTKREQLDLWAMRRDASEFPAAINLSPVRSDGGHVIFSDIRDVTEDRRVREEIQSLNQTLATQNRELTTVNRELEAFSYSVSHDLRAPLRAIDGFSQALVEDFGPSLDETGKDYAQRVRAGAQRMGSLIDDLLKLSRVARADFERDDVDLSAVAKEAFRQLRILDPDREVDVEIEPDLKVRADPRLLQVLLDNLMGNAWKFTAHVAQPKIKVGRETHQGKTVYYVRDNGAGFDMAYSEKLFGPFQRLHDTREFPGTGIGLATVQRIVHRHGGRVWALGEVGHGATFFFTFDPTREERGGQQIDSAG